MVKKDGFLRKVIDYRALNRQTVRNRTPLPRIDDFFHRLQGSTVCSTSLDLTSGNHQILISEERSAKTAFLTPAGSDESKVFVELWPGQCPATFQAVMNRTLAGLYELVYMDVILGHKLNIWCICVMCCSSVRA